MKRLIVFIFISIILFSCQDNEDVLFNADPAEVQISFESFPGGAYLKYTLPDDLDICSIQATYTDHFGKKMNVKGLYTNDKIKLIGFINEEKDIPVEISLLDHGNRVSKSIIKYFSTNEAAAKTFFEHVEVNPHWAGFHVKYNITDGADGFVNIGYIGINPTTQELDTILTKTLPIVSGEEDFYYDKINDPEISEVDVVIWTDDYRGNRVKKVVYEKVAVGKAERFDCSEVGFEGSSDENIYRETSYKYLFDGDTKGYKTYDEQVYKFYCFVSQRESVPGFWTIDLKEEKRLAYVRLYSFLNSDYLPEFYDPYFGTATRYGYPMYLPNSFKIYASNDADAPADEWVELGEHYETSSSTYSSRWTWASVDPTRKYISTEEMEQAEPNYVQVSFDFSDESYRYIRIEVLETFKLYSNVGDPVDNDGRFYAEEFEIYTQINND